MTSFRDLSIGQKLYVLVTLAAVVAAVVGVASLGTDTENVFVLASTTLVVALVSWALGYGWHWFRARQRGEDLRLATIEDHRLNQLIYRADPHSRPPYHFSMGLAWLAATVLVVERAIHLGMNGWLAFGLWLLINLIGIAVYAMFFMQRRTTAQLRADRAASVESHQRLVADRRQYAQRAGAGFEETSVALAEGFGRLAQEIPEDFTSAEGRLAPIREAFQTERTLPVLRHAADLQAEAVVRVQASGFPVVVFDLEVIDQEVLLDTEQNPVSDPAAAAELAKRYLTVWQAELPITLPFVSSLYAYELAYARPEDDPSNLTTVEELENKWYSYLLAGPAAAPGFPARKIGWQEDGLVGRVAGYDATPPDELRRNRRSMMTEHEELAGFLMSVPAVWQAALAPLVPPFYVDGDRLVTASISGHGTEAAKVEQQIARLGELAQAFPWPELERYRVDPAESQRRRAERFYLTHGDLEPTLERWQLGSTRSGPRRYERSHRLYWENRHHSLSQVLSSPPTYS